MWIGFVLMGVGLGLFVQGLLEKILGRGRSTETRTSFR